MAIYFIDDSNYLEHYGVLGMKWGIRKKSKKANGRNKERMAKRAEKRHIKDLKVANRDQRVNALIALGGLYIGKTLGEYGAKIIKVLNTEELLQGQKAPLKLSNQQERVLVNLAAYGSMVIGAAAGAKRYRDTKRARRKLNYEDQR